MRFFCPGCWRDFGREFAVCPHCGLNIAAFDQGKDYTDRLIVALGHREPSTPIRAAWLLGKLREHRAVSALVDVVRQRKDVYLVRAAAEALIAIGGGEASAFVHTLTDHPDVFVRRLARDAVAGQVEKGTPRD